MHRQYRKDTKRSGTVLSRVLPLLVLSIFINYIDRGNLSIAAPQLREEFGLSSSQLGILLSSFFWTYAVFQIVSGWLVDRFDVKWVIAVGFFVWSTATAVTGLIHGFAALLGVRLILGIGESVAYPSYSKILARHFSEGERGFANSVIIAGYNCGLALSMFMGGMLMAKFGWRSFFILFGLVSLLWLFPWFKWMPREQTSITPDRPDAPNILEILRQRSAWGTCAGLFCTNYIAYFLITWLPFYLVRERQFSMDEMAKVAGGAYLLAAIIASLCGWVSDRWIVAGGTPTRVRKTLTGMGMISAGIALAASPVASPGLSIAMLITAAVSIGICSSNVWAMTQTLAGPQAAGRWTGLQNFVGNLAGVVSPTVTGLVVDRTGRFSWAFAITVGVALIGAVAWVFAVGPVEQVVWTRGSIKQE
jgi:ACS family D-galactonate transporter-like MFS transporter